MGRLEEGHIETHPTRFVMAGLLAETLADVQGLLEAGQTIEQRGNVANVPGTGLGLYIVAKYLELLKGTVAVCSALHSKRTNLNRPEVHHLLGLTERHEIDVVVVGQASRLNRIQSQAFEIFEKLMAAHGSVWIERHQLEILLDNGQLNPGAHRAIDRGVYSLTSTELVT